MDVQRINSISNPSRVSKEKEIQESVSFTEVMAKKQRDINYERLSQMMTKIEEQGRHLVKHQTVDSLRKYKTLVKQFMDEAVKNGFEMHEQRGFNRRGTTKVYKLVKEVDSKLIELTNDVLHKEKDGIQLLSQVGEIQGLLLNIYT
ncbi:DUF327 family protein [Priestia megaterium]|nr:DUF327 family protein [Priestia megaterium]